MAHTSAIRLQAFHPAELDGPAPGAPDAATGHYFSAAGVPVSESGSTIVVRLPAGPTLATAALLQRAAELVIANGYSLMNLPEGCGGQVLEDGSFLPVPSLSPEALEDRRANVDRIPTAEEIGMAFLVYSREHDRTSAEADPDTAEDWRDCDMYHAPDHRYFVAAYAQPHWCPAACIDIAAGAAPATVATILGRLAELIDQHYHALVLRPQGELGCFMADGSLIDLEPMDLDP